MEEYTPDNSSYDSSEESSVDSTSSEYSNGYELFGEPDPASTVDDNTLEQLSRHFQVAKYLDKELLQSTQPRQIQLGALKGVLYPPATYGSPRGFPIIKIDSRDSAAGLLVNSKRWAVIVNIGTNTALPSWIGVFSNPPPSAPLKTTVRNFYANYDRRHPGRYMAVLGDPPFIADEWAAGEWDGDVGYASIRMWTLRSYLENRGIVHNQFDHRNPQQMAGRAKIRIPANCAPVDATHHSLHDIVPGGTIAGLLSMDWNIYWSSLGPGILLHSSAFLHDDTHRARWPEKAYTSSESFRDLIQRYHSLLVHKRVWYPPKWAPDGPWRKWYRYVNHTTPGATGSSSDTANAVPYPEPHELDSGLINPAAWKLLEAMEAEQGEPEKPSPTTTETAAESMDTRDTPTVEPTSTGEGEPAVDDSEERGEKSKSSALLRYAVQQLLTDSSDDEVETGGSHLQPSTKLQEHPTAGFPDSTNIQSMGESEPTILTRRIQPPGGTHGLHLEWSGRYEWHTPAGAQQHTDVVDPTTEPNRVRHHELPPGRSYWRPGLPEPGTSKELTRPTLAGVAGAAIYRVGANKPSHNLGRPLQSKPSATSIAIDALLDRHKRSGNCPQCSHPRVPAIHTGAQARPGDTGSSHASGSIHAMDNTARQASGRSQRRRRDVPLLHELNQKETLPHGEEPQKEPLDLSVVKTRDHVDNHHGTGRNDPERVTTKGKVDDTESLILLVDAAHVGRDASNERSPENTTRHAIPSEQGEQKAREAEPAAEKSVARLPCVSPTPDPSVEPDSSNRQEAQKQDQE